MPGGFTQTPAELPDLDEPRDEAGDEADTHREQQ